MILLHITGPHGRFCLPTSVMPYAIFPATSFLCIDSFHGRNTENAFMALARQRYNDQITHLYSFIMTRWR